jgi:hypothetical protein
MIALIFYPDGGRQMLTGPEHVVIPNLRIQQMNGGQIRLLDGTPLEQIGTLADPRVADNVAQFDIDFPGTQYEPPPIEETIQ